MTGKGEGEGGGGKDRWKRGGRKEEGMGLVFFFSVLRGLVMRFNEPRIGDGKYYLGMKRCRFSTQRGKSESSTWGVGVNRARLC